MGQANQSTYKRQHARWLLSAILLSLLIPQSFSPHPTSAEIENNIVYVGNEERDTTSVAWGDYDGNGTLDLAVGNDAQPIQLYTNINGSLKLAWEAPVVRNTTSVAWGDYDGNGTLDLAVGNDGQPIQLYTNINGSLNLVWEAPVVRNTKSVAWSDYDGNGTLDLAVGNCGQPLQMYSNTGSVLNLAWEAPVAQCTTSIAWGDWNNDGTPDLAVGNGQNPNRIYANSGGSLILAWEATSNQGAASVAWGDYDNDGRLDLAFASGTAQIYHNTGQTLILTETISGTNSVSDVAWGDWNNDGLLDLAIGTYCTEGFYGILVPSKTTCFGDEIYEQQPSYLDPPPFSRVWQAPVSARNNTMSVAWADYDNDGDLDLVAGSTHFRSSYNPTQMRGEIHIYPNENSNFLRDQYFNRFTTSLAWGDYNGDGKLDLALGNAPGSFIGSDVTIPVSGESQVYVNDGETFHLAWTAPQERNTKSIAWGDYNGDGKQDLVLGNDGQPNQIYLNTGSDLTLAWEAPVSRSTTSVAWGDYDGDGRLDLAVGNNGQPNQIYLNTGTSLVLTWEAPVSRSTTSVAWGDYDSDSRLDLAVGNDGQPNEIYANHDGNLVLAWVSALTRNTTSVAWGDYDGDSRLDLAIGNRGQVRQVYHNDGAIFRLAWESVRDEAMVTSVAWGDYDGDGRLDLAAGVSDCSINGGGFPRTIICSGSYLYHNNVNTFEPAPNTSWLWGRINGLAWADADNDGDLDLATAIGGTESATLYANPRLGGPRLGVMPPQVSIAQPNNTPAAFFIASSGYIDQPILSIPYTLHGQGGGRISRIQGYYSVDGGGQWLPTRATTDTVTTNLAIDGTYTYHWDLLGSGFFGQSDTVVFRLDVTGATGPFQYAKTTAYSAPFRVRGTQVQVTENGSPVANAQVYRLSNTHGGTLEPITSSAGAQAYTTDAQGFLRGRGQITLGDTLIALRPISVTGVLSDGYKLYHTNILTSATGITGFLIQQPGVQRIDVSAAHPLALFRLDISLEWDAHNDKRFMDQLDSDLGRASEFLFNATNGQAALGEVRIFQDKQWWDAVNLRIYASNRVRPNASVGGVTTRPITDAVSLRPDNPVVPPVVYGPGQLRMGSIWNRFGSANTSLGEDWPRTLAHELGHYLFFLEDNYIGTTDQGQIIPINSCPGLMSDPYGSNVEFHPHTGWDTSCAQTLSNRSSGRDDWATARTFYPALIAPTVGVTGTEILGPTNLPLAVTQITSYGPITPTAMLDVPIFYLTDGGTRHQPGLSARGYLFSNRQADSNLPPDRITALGRANLDQILARGAHIGDRVCVYEPDGARPGTQIGGCTTVAAGNEQIALYEQPGWPPDVTVTPVTSTTLALRVTGVPPDAQALGLSAQLFPAHDDLPATPPVALQTADGTVYSGTITLAAPVDEAQIHLWINDPNTDKRREIVTSLAIGGNPGFARTGGGLTRIGGGFARTGGGFARTGGGFARTGGGFARTGGAPVSSSEGDVLLVGDNLTFAVGQFLALQTTSSLPKPPSWTTVVGNAYRFTASSDIVGIKQTALSFSYLDSDVPAGEEDGIAVYFWDDKAITPAWERVTTTTDPYYNIASIPNQGTGLYALMASVDIRIQAPGWNLVAYPVRATRPVTEALASIKDAYTTVYGYNAADIADPWKIYDVAAPEWVNDLDTLEFGRGYWINATEAITLYLKGNSPTPNVRTAAARTALGLPTPPATYYGIAPIAAPTGGLVVQAWIDGSLCGQDQTVQRSIAGTLRDTFAINVRAANAGSDAACGAPGKQVTLRFLDGTREVARFTTPWDNSHAIAVAVQPTVIYLPAVHKQSGQ